MRYPNGSIPYGGDEDLALRLRRMLCSAVHHHPRQRTGSWCFGYGYVCSRCFMYADPIPREKLRQMCDTLNAMPPEDQQGAAARMSGGGPIR